MKSLIIISLLILMSCSKEKLNSNENIFKYSENMDFNEFKLKLEQYVKTNPYPVLNE
jgi:hypothetical protein|tara:strand:- start:567 stop:737 length:171 start_codon:yes stop_codon:yes gene_type:complete